MGWFSKEVTEIKDDLESLAEKHRQAEEDFTQDYATGLAILRGVKADASKYAQDLRARAAVLTASAESLARKFEADLIADGQQNGSDNA